MLSKSFFANLSIISRLMRIPAPTGYILCYLPAMFGLMLAYEEPANLVYIPIFLLASIVVRAAGCIINDIFDRDFDQKVIRTKARPLASKQLSLKKALIILSFLLIASLALLLTLTKTAIIIGFICFILFTLYPLMKRFTYFPQVFLGFTFNLGSLIAYAAIKDDLSINAIILYSACGFWTVAYDTIYAFMDIEDDLAIGVKSMAIFLKKRQLPTKLILALLYFIFFLLFTISFWQILGIYLVIALIIASLLASSSIFTLKLDVADNCLQRFKINNYLGFSLFLGLLLEKLV